MTASRVNHRLATSKSWVCHGLTRGLLRTALLQRSLNFRGFVFKPLVWENPASKHEVLPQTREIFRDLVI